MECVECFPGFLDVAVKLQDAATAAGQRQKFLTTILTMPWMTQRCHCLGEMPTTSTKTAQLLSNTPEIQPDIYRPRPLIEVQSVGPKVCCPLHLKPQVGEAVRAWSG